MWESVECIFQKRSESKVRRNGTIWSSLLTFDRDCHPIAHMSIVIQAFPLILVISLGVDCWWKMRRTNYQKGWFLWLFHNSSCVWKRGHFSYCLSHLHHWSIIHRFKWSCVQNKSCSRWSLLNDPEGKVTADCTKQMDKEQLFVSNISELSCRSKHHYNSIWYSHIRSCGEYQVHFQS